VKIANTAECFSSSLAAENFVSTLKYWRCISTPSETSLVRARLALEVTAPRLGEGRDTILASRLIILTILPNCIGILPLSSRDRRSCARTSHGAFCFALHIFLESEVLGSQGTYLASREALLASVEVERSWDEVRPVAYSIKDGFCSVATEALAIETFLCFHTWSTGLPQERSSLNFSWSK